MVIVDGVDAPLPPEDGIGIYSRKALLLLASLITQLYFLKGEQVVVGLFKKLKLFVRVAHDSRLLPLKGLPGEIYIVACIGGYLADVGQFDGLS